jgi:hypothetical protein
VEIWKDTEYEPYEVSSHGKVRNKKTGRLLVPAVHHKGYLKAQFRVNKKTKAFFRHRLVGIAFIPNPYNLPQIDHLDNDKTNNHVSNLEWVTGAENIRRKMRDGLNVSPENAGRPKQPVAQYDLEGNFVANYKSIAEAVVKTGLRQSGISAVLRGSAHTVGGFVFKRINTAETL